MSVALGLTAGLLTQPVIASVSAAPGRQTIVVTDVAGREVAVTVPVQRVLLGEGRLLYSVAAIDSDEGP